MVWKSEGLASLSGFGGSWIVHDGKRIADKFSKLAVRELFIIDIFCNGRHEIFSVYRIFFSHRYSHMRHTLSQYIP